MSSDEKRLKTMSETQDVVSNEDITRTTRHHVMNDDVLGLIFNELSVKQLLRLEVVCNQFMDCVGSALKRKNALHIYGYLMEGSHMCDILHKEYHSLKSGDISEAIATKRIGYYDLIQNKLIFESMLKKCPHIQSLYLSMCEMDCKTIEVIINECPQLRRLHLDYITIESSQVMANNSLKQLLSQLNHLTISSEVEDSLYNQMHHLLPDLSSLYLIDCIEDNEQIHVNTLPQTLHCLQILNNNLNNLPMDQLVKRCPHLRKLSINYLDADDECNQSFVTICNHLKLISFSFEVESQSLETQTFINNIPKLKDLKHLTIDSPIDLDTNMKPMPALRSLSLMHITISPQMLTNIHKVFPQLRQLVLNGIRIDRNGNELKDCIHKCMQSISLLPKLKTLCIVCRNFYSNGLQSIDCKDLLLFIELNFLRLKSYDNCHELYDFIVNCIEKRVSNKCLRLSLDFKTKETLVKQLNDTNITIPKWMAIQSHVMLG